MRIVHLSDTHLGYTGQGFQRLVEDPWRPGLRVRQQEADVMLGLLRAVDRIIETVRPAVVLHTGDLFDRALPTPHALDFAMAQFRRLADAGIPILVVEGDHSSPRNQSQGQVLRVLLHLPGVTVVCGDAAIVRIGELVVHALPHRALAREERPNRDALDPRSPNILVTHGVADGWGYFRTHRLAASVPIRECADWYEYVGIGHSHRFAQVTGTDRAFYAGATAMAGPLDFRPGYAFGFNVVELTGGPPVVRRECLETRPMHAYGLDDASGMSPGEILGFLQRQADASPPRDAYCQVRITALDPLVRRTLSIREIEAIFQEAAILSLTMDVNEPRWASVRDRLKAGDPPARFVELSALSDGEPPFKERVQALGQEILARAAESVGAEDLDGI